MTLWMDSVNQKVLNWHLTNKTMVSPSIKERFRRAGINLRLLEFWLGTYKGLPPAWSRGGYSRIKFARLSIALAALLNVSVLMMPTSIGGTSLVNVWFGFVASAYILAAIVFLLGLRIWYLPSVLFFIVSAIVSLLISSSYFQPAAWAASSDWTMIVAFAAFAYVVVGGLVLMKYDNGSGVNTALSMS
jgi:hypothetical protein